MSQQSGCDWRSYSGYTKQQNTTKNSINSNRHKNVYSTTVTGDKTTCIDMKVHNKLMLASLSLSLSLSKIDIITS